MLKLPKSHKYQIVRKCSAGRTGVRGTALVAPPNFAKVEKRTAAEIEICKNKQFTIILPPQIFGSSAAPAGDQNVLRIIKDRG